MSDGNSSARRGARTKKSRGEPANEETPLSDDAQVELLRSGDERAFSQLLHRYHRQMVHVASHFVSSESVAEEVVQETWLAVLRGLPSFERRASLKTWIFRILTNRAKTRGVRERRSVPFSALGEVAPAGAPAVESGRFTQRGSWVRPPAPWGTMGGAPEAHLLGKETQEVLRAALAQLPKNQRMVVTLRDVRGWTCAEVCEALGISETNQRVLLHRGRSRVRQSLARHLAGES